MAGRTHPDHRAAGQRRQLRRAPRGPGGVRAVRAARRDGSACRVVGRPRIVLARRRCRGARAVARPHRLAVPDRGRGRRGLLRSGVRRPRRGPPAQGRRGGQPAGAAGRVSLARRVRRGRPNRSATGGATGWRTRVRLDTSTTAAPDSTATTARSSSPTCDCAQLPQRHARRPRRDRLAARVRMCMSLSTTTGCATSCSPDRA